MPRLGSNKLVWGFGQSESSKPPKSKLLTSQKGFLAVLVSEEAR